MRRGLCYHKLVHTLVVRGWGRGAYGPNFLNFMQFFGNFESAAHIEFWSCVSELEL